MALGKIPKSARLGAWGFAAVVVAGVALLPMAGNRGTIAADPPAEKSIQAAGAQGQGAPAASPPKVAEEQPKPDTKPRVILHGRAIDDKGTPVANAEL